MLQKTTQLIDNAIIAKKQIEVTWKIFGFAIYRKTVDKALAYDLKELGCNLYL